MKNQQELSYKLQRLEKIFDFEKVLSVNTDEESVAKYYKINRIPYSLFNSKQFVHMTIRRKGSTGLLEQAVIVDKYIKIVTLKMFLKWGVEEEQTVFTLQKNTQALSLPE